MSKRRQGQTKGSGKPHQAGSERQPPRRGTSPADLEFARRLAEAPPQAAYRLLDPEAVREAHRVVLPGSILATAQGPYFQPTAPDGTPVLAEHGMAQVADALARMQPRDPLEEMLVQQTLWVHARIGHLTRIANTQQGLEQIAVIGEALERAHNTYRRLMLALAEYRNPRIAKNFTAFKQINRAEKQVVQNTGEVAGEAGAEKRNSENENATNEKGFGREAPALPAVSEGVDLAAEINRSRQAVAENVRAGDGNGQSQVQPQRAQARPADGGRDAGAGVGDSGPADDAGGAAGRVQRVRADRMTPAERAFSARLGAEDDAAE